jgi:hypothetical protein
MVTTLTRLDDHTGALPSLVSSLEGFGSPMGQPGSMADVFGLEARLIAHPPAFAFAIAKTTRLKDTKGCLVHRRHHCAAG